LHIPIFHIYHFLEIKILEVGKRWGAEPDIHGGGTVLEKVRQDVEAIVGTWVGREDAGDSAGEGLVGGVKLLILTGVGLGLSGEVCAIKDEREGEPNVAPLVGEDLGTSSFLGGEKQNYHIEDGIGGAVDAVDVVFAAATTTSSFRQRRRRW
jgi:hypothetical protein